MKKILLPLFLAFAGMLSAQTTDISGLWRFKTDPADKGITEKWFDRKLDDNILLPGSMPQRLKGDLVTIDTKWTGSIYDSSFYFNPRLEKYRRPGNVKFSFFLTPARHYVGAAWYQRDIEIPVSWKGRSITLFLERPHIDTRVWIDSKEVGIQRSLSVPHTFDLSAVSPGKHTVTILIDNRIKDINVGQDSHSITDQTQGNWNGIVGRMELQARDRINFEDIQIFPDLAAKSAKVKMVVNSAKKGSLSGTITLSAKSFNTSKKLRGEPEHTVAPLTIPFTTQNGHIEAVLPMGDGVLLWDEFDPNLYMLTAKLDAQGATDERSVQFGMREFTIEGRYFYVNGHKTVLRGTVENAVFPLTGYPPMDVDSWKRVFAISRSFGLNHMRFHSFCPPEAAFIAADLMGFYLQPEGPSWPNHGSSLGDNKPIDKYLYDETIAMGKYYGNYASYCMLASGNEPYGREWVRWVGEFVDFWKARDTRRVYTGASVGGGWAWQPKSQFHVKAGARGLAWDKMPESHSTFTAQMGHVAEPFVSHETGQWCAFPNFTEIRKYTGVNRALNFEMFREDLADHDMANLAQDFLISSGKLQALCYKHEIEKTLRTPNYAGFQLLSLNDYSGQGTALVGVLDAFWDEKGYITAAEFRRFCNSTVPLAKMEKFVFKGTETMKAQIETSHFGREPLKNAVVAWKITDIFGQVLAKGNFSGLTIPVGNCNTVGDITFDLAGIRKASKLNLEVAVAGTEFVNDWDFWVYPALGEPKPGNVYITDTLDAKTIEMLGAGRNVLLLADGKISYGKSIIQRMTPVFWNTSWFKMRPPHTTGIFVNDYHFLFRDFPTASYSNLQWWEIVNNAQVMLLTDFPEGFQPVIQSIDTWFHNRKIGMLIEAKVGTGKLIVCSADLRHNLENRIVARQLLESTLNYMNSDYFRPEFTVDLKTIRDLFTKIEPPLDTFTKQNPDELKPKIN